MSRIKELADGVMAIYGFLQGADKLFDVYKHEANRRRNIRYKHKAKAYAPQFSCAEFESKDAAVDFLNTMETWTNMNQAKVVRQNGKWTVQMPKFTPIYESKKDNALSNQNNSIH